jgi:hypothetical protein
MRTHHALAHHEWTPFLVSINKQGNLASAQIIAQIMMTVKMVLEHAGPSRPRPLAATN